MTEQDFTTEQPQTEIWLPVVGYVGRYEVSSFGRVKRIKVFNLIGRKEQILKLSKLRRYIHVSLYKNRRFKGFYVHRLVAIAFIGLVPEGKQVNHKDTNRFNNHVSNLEYLTPAENVLHASANGVYSRGAIKRATDHPELVLRGERNGNAKLNASQVREIRSLIGTITRREIAARFQVSMTTIDKIGKRRTYVEVV